MSKLDSGVGTRVGGIVIKERREDDLLGIAFQDARDAAPTSSSDFLLYRRGTSLYVWDGSGETQIVAGGAGGSTPAWETLFAADATFTITPDVTFTIAGNRASATDVLTLSNIAGGSGAVLQFSNAGTGKDIDGTSDTWSVSKAGAAIFAGVSISGTTSAIATTGAADWTLLDNSAAALTIGAADATSMLNFDTRNGAEVVGITAGFAVTGNSTLTGASNTVSTLVVENNTVTTFGAGPAADAGVAVLTSTSLTTGTLLKLQLTEGTLNGGLYLECFDETAAGVVFSIGEDGALVITGAGGSDMLTVTAGDVVLSDGSITLTDADNAVSLKVTNNTATTVGAAAATGIVELASTSLTTGTLLHLELTEGTLNGGKYVKMWDVTAGAEVFSVAEDGLTTIAGAGGSNMLVITAGDALMSDGSLTMVDADNAATLSITNNTATTIGAAASGGVATLISTSLTTGALLNLELTEGTLNGGWYLRAWDATGGAAVFSVGEDGLTTIAGAGGSNMLVITAGDAVMSDGSLTITDADNAATVSVTNNTATTIGAAASGGVATLISTSLTTGALLNLELTEGTLNGGWYVRAWDATAGAAVFSVGEDGATVIAGVGGSNVLTITAGDMLMSDGSITVVDADNAATISITNNTATTIGAAASGGVMTLISTSLTTGALLNLELTEGTLNGGWYIRAWDATGSAAVFSVGEDGAMVTGTGTVNHGGAFILSGTETIAAGGTSTALSLTKVVHYIDADAGGDTFTLADGTAGQIMTILLTSSTGTATITPTNLAGGTSVTLNADGDTVVLQFMDTEWFILGGNSYAVV